MFEKLLLLILTIAPCASLGSSIDDRYAVRSGKVNARILDAQRDLFIAAEIREAANIIASASTFTNCMTDDPLPKQRFEPCAGRLETELVQTKSVKSKLDRLAHAAKNANIRLSAEKVRDEATLLEDNLEKLRNMALPFFGADLMYPKAPIVGFEKADTRRTFCARKLTGTQKAQVKYRSEFDSHVRIGDVHSMRSDFVNTKALWDGARFLATRCLLTPDEIALGLAPTDLTTALYQMQIESLDRTLQYMRQQSQAIAEGELIARACANVRPGNKAAVEEICRHSKLNFHTEYTLHLALTTDLTNAGGAQ